MSFSLKFLPDYAPLVLRLAGGVIFGVHGYQKLFGGMEKFAATVAAINLPPYFAQIGAIVELVGGILLVLGLLVRLASFLLAGQMAVAIVKFHILYLHQGLVMGFEFPLVMLAMMLALFLLGSGAWSLDRKLFGWS
ncbi:MAG TPA: DoxX family protein [Acidobacteriota bacterium]|nr:DoxX family protein [Acidobacteriota bacterium]